MLPTMGAPGDPTAPGWYENAHEPGVLHYFDGTSWSPQTRRRGEQPPSAGQAWQPLEPAPVGAPAYQPDAVPAGLGTPALGTAAFAAPGSAPEASRFGTPPGPAPFAAPGSAPEASRFGTPPGPASFGVPYDATGFGAPRDAPAARFGTPPVSPSPYALSTGLPEASRFGTPPGPGPLGTPYDAAPHGIAAPAPVDWQSPPPAPTGYPAPGYIGAPPALATGWPGPAPWGPPAPAPAHWGWRALGLLIDYLVMVVPVYLVGFAVGIGYGATHAQTSTGLPQSLVDGLTTFSFVTEAVIWFVNRSVFGGLKGRSLGRLATGTRLVGEQSQQPLGIWMAFVRDVAHVLDNVLLGIGWLWPLWDAKRQTLADKAVHSLVVR
jgi:uncharacterized RDD family membrane protein YckC